LGKALRTFTAYDAGSTWRMAAVSVPMVDLYGGPLTLRFLTPDLGFAVPGADGGQFWWTNDDGATSRAIVVQVGGHLLFPDRANDGAR
jgi:hypothetical protein